MSTALLKPKRPQVEVVCRECGVPFRKDRRELERQKRSGRVTFFCTASCSAAFGNKQSPITGSIANFGDARRVSDELSPFRYYVRKARWRPNRNSLDNLKQVTCEYLKALWDEQNGRCAITGLKIVVNKAHMGANDPRTLASLDRIDSTKPYEVGNVQFVSSCINMAKSVMSNSDMLDFVRAIRDGKDLI